MTSLLERPDLSQLGADVAEQLNAIRPGETWSVRPARDGFDQDGRWMVYLVEASDPERVIYINSTWSRNGRLTVGGSYPSNGSYYRRDDQPKSITVAGDKSPEAIAKDAARRFIPAYLAALATAQERRDRDVSYENNRDTLARDLAERCGTTPYKHSAGRWSAYRDSGGYFCDCEASGDGTVELKIRNLPADKARRIIAVVMGE